MRFSYGLIALVLASCAHPDRASLIMEPPSEAISPSGILLEPVGIETLGGVFTPVLPEGCKLPCVVSEAFSTAEDDQGHLVLSVFRGEAALAQSNRFLGRFQISGIAPLRRGEPNILAEFKADRGGIMLTAMDGDGKSKLSLTRLSP